MAEKPDTTPVGVGEGARAPKGYTLSLADAINDAKMALSLLELTSETLLKDSTVFREMILKALPYLGAYRIMVLTPEEFEAMDCALGLMSERFDAVVKKRDDVWPAFCSPARVSPLRRMFEDWQAAKHVYNTSGVDGDDTFEDMAKIERAADAFEPRTLEDFAFRVIFADDNGDMNMGPAQEALVSLSYRLAGVDLDRRLSPSWRKGKAA